MYYSRYGALTAERFLRRLVAYAVVLPIILTLWLVTAIGDWLCRQYYFGLRGGKRWLI